MANLATMPAAPTLTDRHRSEFRERGFTVLERVIPDAHLALLRRECDRLTAETDARMDAAGTDVDGLSHRRNRYFISAWQRSEAVREFIFSELMAGLCAELVGPEAYLSFEQFVVKFPGKGMKFAWHQDSGYVPSPHRPYLSCWCTLDDVDERNGTVYMLPYDRAGTRERVQHVREDGSNDLVGYDGDDPGEPVVAPAGSIALFSSTVFHRSGQNTSAGIRRIFLPQYSAAPLLNRDGSAPIYLAERFLRGGERIRSR